MGALENRQAGGRPVLLAASQKKQSLIHEFLVGCTASFRIGHALAVAM